MTRRPASPEKTKQASDLSAEHGVDHAAKLMGISRETLRRYVRDGRATLGKPVDVDRSRLLTQIAERYTEQELHAIARGHVPDVQVDQARHDFAGKTVNFGVMSDSHIGSTYLNESRMLDAYREFQRAKVEFVVHVGDVTEGMSQRPGHVYELAHIGYGAQKQRAIELLSKWDKTPIYMIDGNHDRWFIKSSGAYIVADICSKIPNAKYLGSDQGVIELGGGASMMLWHGEDGGGSYALSYRLQKIVESLKGGQKPNILCAGHDHKAGYFFIRNIHCFASGCMQSQSSWMRGKRLAAHEGFWILSATIGDGVKRIASEFFPYYD